MFNFVPVSKEQVTDAPVRNQRFARTPMSRKWWLGGDPVATAFYNSLSLTFPPGEKFCVEAVRCFREGAAPRLASEIATFVQQEMEHTREHLIFNRRVTESGYDTSNLNRKIDQHFARLRSKPEIERLAAAIAIEHLTSTFAHELLSDSSHMRNADADEAALWRWHSRDEIDHKGVAYDTWLHATRDWGRVRRWLLKSRVMLSMSYAFITNRTAGALELLKQDGLSGPRIWLAFARFALVYPGLFRHAAKGHLTFFLPGFHPWNIDDRALIEDGASA
jgi:uncharacterized protein